MVHYAEQFIEKALTDPHLTEHQRTTMCTFEEELRATNFASSTRRSYVMALRDLALFSGKNFEALEKKDLISWINDLNQRLKKGTPGLYKAKIKRFYKWLEIGSLNAKHYPEKVAWIMLERGQKSLPINTEDILNPEEITLLVKKCLNMRDRALIMTLYESGCRAQEVLSLNKSSVVFNKNGCVITVNGKTGKRRLPLVFSAPYLHHWLNYHPLKAVNAPLWVNFKTNQPLTYFGLWKLCKYLKKRAQLNKPLNPHIFRHSRATYLAKHLTEYELCQFMGWTIGSSMARRYVHLSGRDLDPKILALSGVEVEKEESLKDLPLKAINCLQCGHKNPIEATYCSGCGLALDEKIGLEVLRQEQQREKKFSDLTKEMKTLQQQISTFWRFFGLPVIGESKEEGVPPKLDVLEAMEEEIKKRPTHEEIAEAEKAKNEDSKL